MDDTRVEQLSTPIKKLLTIPSTYSLDQAAKVALRDKIYSRVPISGTSKSTGDFQNASITY